MAKNSGASGRRKKMEGIAEGLPTKAAKIRALAAKGYSCSQIAHFLKIRYQHVYNTLKRSTGERAPDRQWGKVGPGGRIVIPVTYRRALGLSPGSDVQLVLKGDEVRIVPRDAVVRRAQELVRKHVPEGVSLVDDLLEERRREVAKEEAETEAWRPKRRVAK